MIRVITMGQGSAERYAPGPNELCVSITTPGCADAQLHGSFSEVLRLQFVDYQWPRWRDVPGNITPRQAAGVVEFIRRNPSAYRCVIHCTVGASRSVSMAMALESEGLAVYDKPEWWGQIKGENDPAQGWIPNRGVFARISEAARRDTLTGSSRGR